MDRRIPCKCVQFERVMTINNHFHVSPEKRNPLTFEKEVRKEGFFFKLNLSCSSEAVEEKIHILL